MHNVMWLAGIGVVSLLVTALISRWRKRGGGFDKWWDAEGVVFFILISGALIVAAGVFGIFQFETWG